MAFNFIDVFGLNHLRKASAAEWEQSDYIPLEGEFIVYSADETHTNVRLKLGDGYAYAKDLPFVGIDNLDGVDLSGLVAERVGHKLTFGAGEVYEYDGSEEVTVPVYMGEHS